MPIIKRILIWCRNILIFLFISSILAVVAYKFIPVYYTPLMLTRLYDQHKAGKPFKLDHTWVPLSEIAQPLVQAVVASEDNLFLDHNGFDIEQIQKARDEARERETCPWCQHDLTADSQERLPSPHEKLYPERDRSLFHPAD